MQRLLSVVSAIVIGAALGLPAAAGAEIIEVGKIDPVATPSCPTGPCVAISRTTGYQAKSGATRGPMVIPQDGRIVAWTISLGKPGPKQTAFFQQRLGGEASAQITILGPRRKLRSRAIAHGELIKLTPYFGSTVQFALEKTIAVKKGQVVALTVPTWAPALAVGLGADTSWRASRGRDKCEDTQTQVAQTLPNQLAQYFCLYRTARVAYSAMLVTNPIKSPDAKVDRPGKYSVVKQSPVYENLARGIAGTMLEGNTFKLERLSASGNWAYGIAYGHVNRHAWIKASVLAER